MALQIANPTVVAKVDSLAGEQATADPERMQSLLAQLDRIPDRPDAHKPLQWDEQGLPK